MDSRNCHISRISLSASYCMGCWNSYERALLTNITLVTHPVYFCNFFHYWKSCGFKYSFIPKSSVVVKQILLRWHMNSALLSALWICSLGVNGKLLEYLLHTNCGTCSSHKGNLSLTCKAQARRRQQKFLGWKATLAQQVWVQAVASSEVMEGLEVESHHYNASFYIDNINYISTYTGEIL